MIDISSWMNTFTTALKSNFGERVQFVGLQGSYRRGEATSSSDIDVVVILDELLDSDIKAYGTMLESLPHRELVCGFISGKDELLGWEPSDLFQFYYDTEPVSGTLDGILPLIDDTAVERAIKIGACSIYHGCVHNMLHEKSEDILRGLYKSASFTTQAIAFKQTGKYVKRQSELLEVVAPEERLIIDTFIKLRNGGDVDFERMSENLFAWSKKLIAR